MTRGYDSDGDTTKTAIFEANGLFVAVLAAISGSSRAIGQVFVSGLAKKVPRKGAPMESPTVAGPLARPKGRVAAAYRVVAGGFGALAVGLVFAVAVALISGIRPVVIQTGSMGDAAPAGSLVLAGPAAPQEVQVGDIVVMRRPGRATVTHRVIGIDLIEDQLVATTKGDANPNPDPDPYVIGDNVLTSRFAIGKLGTVVGLTADGGLLFLFAGVLAAAAIYSFAPRRRHPKTANSSQSPLPEPAVAGSKGSVKSPAVVAVVVAVIAASAGSALGLYSATASSLLNDFSSSDCFSPEVTQVQKGLLTIGGQASVDALIAPVDPARSFVTATVRTDSANASDSAIGVELVGTDTVRAHKNVAGTTTNSIVEWRVITYRCGLTVQRGSVMGNGLTSLQIPTNDSPVGTAFALISRTTDAVDRPMDASDHLAVESQRFFVNVTSGVPIPTTHEIFWQSVRFDSASDISVQTVTGTLTAGSSTTVLTLAQAVDPSSTFIIAGVRVSPASGPDSAMVRAHLQDSASISVSRVVSTGAADVVVQVVTLLDGTTVRHGIVDFAIGETAAQITIPTVDPAFTTAMATVQSSGNQNGGQRGSENSVIGEGHISAAVSTSTTVDLERTPMGAPASFGWQVIEWGGPAWPPGSSEFRKRIDVTANSAVAAPNGYTIPVSFDHEQLVNIGISLPSGDDIRVMRFDGTTWSELDRILAEGSVWDDPSTTFWFQTADPIAAGQTVSYWMFLGDPTPPPPLDDPENVWLIYETFDAGTLGDFSDQSGTGGWYQADSWTERRLLTISAADVDSELINFPLLVRTSGVTSAHSDGADIRFTASDGVTFLDHEIGSWNQATGDLEAWVDVPFVSSTSNTSIWMYSGAADAPRSETERDVWPVTSTVVFHLDSDPTLTPEVIDSAGARDGVAYGSISAGQSVPGVVGQALSLDGVDDLVRASSSSPQTQTGFTTSLWFQSPATTGDGVLVSKAGSSSTPFEISVSTGNTVRAVITASGQSSLQANFSPDAWHHFFFTWDGTRTQIYVDGAQLGNLARAGNMASSTAELSIGARSDGSRPYLGLVDEVQIYGGGQGPAWANATYESQRPGSTFVTVAAPQTGSWFGQGVWTFRTPVTVDANSLSTDLFNYPVLVSGTHPGLTAARADGNDLIFTAADGVTRLAHQLEGFNRASGTFSAWVNVPVLPGGTTERLYLYYGNASAQNQQEPTAVFGTEFLGVWHLSD